MEDGNGSINSNSSSCGKSSPIVVSSTSNSKKIGNNGMNRSCIRPRRDSGASYKGVGEMTIKASSYKDSAYEVMRSLRRGHILTDVKIEAGNESFEAHKIILAAASPYFKAMFTSGLCESDMNTVRLQGVCPTTLGLLLLFIYTGEVTVSEKVVCQLLPAAVMFQMCHVMDACCTFLEMQLDPGNVIGIANFAFQHGCMELFRKANVFIEQHFAEVAKEEEFLELSFCQLVKLIERDELNVADEKEVYHAVVRWVKHDEDARSAWLEDVLKAAVRVQFIPPVFLEEQMHSCKLLKKIPACKELLANTFKMLTDHTPRYQKERNPKAPCVIYVVGGLSKQISLDTLDCFDMEEGTWNSLAGLPVGRFGIGVAYLGRILYVVGGRKYQPSRGSHYHETQDMKQLDSYDPQTNAWKTCTSMSVARNRPGVGVLDGQLYVVGGTNGNLYYNSMERYDPSNNTWTPLRPMRTPRMSVGVAVVNRLLYAVGGFDGAVRLKTVEAYHPERDKWLHVRPMRMARSGAGVCAVGDSIYVLGGYDGARQLASVEKYDPQSDTWIEMTPLRTPRSAMTVAVWDQKIFVIGGFDGAQALCSVEIFNSISNEWSQGQPLPYGRSGHAAASSYHPCMLHCGGK